MSSTPSSAEEKSSSQAMVKYECKGISKYMLLSCHIHLVTLILYKAEIADIQRELKELDFKEVLKKD